MVSFRLIVASAFILGSLAVAPTASAQANSGDCRRTCDRSFQTCSRNSTETACRNAWNACKNRCRTATARASTTPTPNSPRARMQGNR